MANSMQSLIPVGTPLKIAYIPVFVAGNGMKLILLFL